MQIKKFYKWCKSFFKHPFKKTTQNCPCYDEEGNFIGWFSRSVAVVMFTFVKDDNGEYYVLASQRGPGTPDPEYVGAWNVTCGYLDFNERLEDAAFRETREETGVEIDSSIRFLSFNSDPDDDKRQNVTARFGTILPNSKEYYESQFSHDNNETEEVGNIAFIKLADIENHSWAFNHNSLIMEAWSEITGMGM